MPLQATSGAASQDAFGGNGVAVVPTYIEDVFSTWLYTGNDSTQNIVNGIDLSTKGGMVWLKCRSLGVGHYLYDTVRGIANGPLSSENTSAAYTSNTPKTLTSFNTNGFSMQDDSASFGANVSPRTYASWTFRKQPKMFDIQTWTGTGGSRTITTALNGTTGCIILKRTDTSDQWWVVHRSGANGFDSYGILNQTAAFTATGSGISSVTDTSFTISSYYNGSGSTWVAYIFAHNAGGFGLTGTDNVISCGSYTGTGANGNFVSLGYEPQWVMVKRTNTTGNWSIHDTMRGTSNTSYAFLEPNVSDAESASSASSVLAPTATGFNANGGGSTTNASGSTYIYIAIRRGPMKVPTTGTSVYNAIARTGTGTTATVTGVGFAPDMYIATPRTGANVYQGVVDKLRGKTQGLVTSITAAETSATVGDTTAFGNDGISLGIPDQLNMNLNGQAIINWFFRRAPSFMDVVCYTGTGSARTVSHNLAAVPELMIVKRRDSSTAGSWFVYTSFVGNTGYVVLNATAVPDYWINIWNDTTPTSTQFTVGSYLSQSGGTHVAYLFATCAGVSKVFSYTGNGSSQTINCGFTGGARFVLIRRTDSAGDWYVWDTARGIVSGNDPHISLNTTAAEVTTDDTIDTESTGFVVNQVSATNVNVSSATYIGLAIA
jgi:hypothetical protein